MRILPKSNLRQYQVKNGIKRCIKGINNSIQYKSAIILQAEFNIQGNNNIIIIHPGAYLSNVSFNIYGDNHRIIIGKDCQFNGCCNIWAEDQNCMISIGKNTTFEGVHLSATEPDSKLTIGEDCMFSYDIDVRTGDSHSIISKINGQRTNYARDILFGDHIWVASHCIFTKGTRVASNSIVGTGSLVNKAFDVENVLIAGRPARIMKKDIEWSRERVYQVKNVSQLSCKSDAFTCESPVEYEFNKKTG